MASTKKTLRLAYRTFVGFERALTRQTQEFRKLHPDVEVELVPSGATYENTVDNRAWQ